MSSETEKCCKVGRVAAKRGLTRLDDELRRRRGAGASLRDLEGFLNERVLERALDEANEAVVGDPESLCRTLQSSDVDAGRKAELRANLERAGVDVDAVEDDFISHQTIRDHLRDCLDVDTSRETRIDRERGHTTISWAQSRSQAVIEQTLQQLRNAGELATGNLDVTQTARVTCTDCGATYRLDELLDSASCECGDHLSEFDSSSDL